MELPNLNQLFVCCGVCRNPYFKRRLYYMTSCSHLLCDLHTSIPKSYLNDQNKSLNIKCPCCTTAGISIKSANDKDLRDFFVPAKDTFQKAFEAQTYQEKSYIGLLNYQNEYISRQQKKIDKIKQFLKVARDEIVIFTKYKYENQSLKNEITILQEKIKELETIAPSLPPTRSLHFQNKVQSITSPLSSPEKEDDDNDIEIIETVKGAPGKSFFRQVRDINKKDSDPPNQPRRLPPLSRDMLDFPSQMAESNNVQNNFRIRHLGSVNTSSLLTRENDSIQHRSFNATNQNSYSRGSQMSGSTSSAGFRSDVFNKPNQIRRPLGGTMFDPSFGEYEMPNRNTSRHRTASAINKERHHPVSRTSTNPFMGNPPKNLEQLASSLKQHLKVGRKSSVNSLGIGSREKITNMNRKFRKS